MGAGGTARAGSRRRRRVKGRQVRWGCYPRRGRKSTTGPHFRGPVRLDWPAPGWHVPRTRPPSGRSRTIPPPPHLSLVMPAFNEEAGIVEAVAEAHEALAGLGYEFEILVVDDGSTDRTAERVADLAAFRPRVRLLTHRTNLGYGAALRTGFEAAEYDLVAFTDADGQFFLDDLDDLVPLTRKCHVAVGRRVSRQDPWRRRFLSWGYNRLARLLLGT